MGAIKKLVAAYMAIVAVAVAGFFIINIFLVDAINITAVWGVLDVLMLIGLAMALVFNWMYKAGAGRGDPDQPVTRNYLAANFAFYITVIIAIVFLHNWLVFVVTGQVSQGDNHSAWVLWAVVDTGLPILFAATGCRLWRESSSS